MEPTDLMEVVMQDKEEERESVGQMMAEMRAGCSAGCEDGGGEVEVQAGGDPQDTTHAEMLDGVEGRLGACRDRRKEFSFGYVLQQMPPGAPQQSACAGPCVMTKTYDRVMAEPSVNWHLRAVLREVGLDRVADLRSEQLKCKWTQEEEEPSAYEAKSTESVDALAEDLHLCGRQLQVLELTDYKVEWRKSSKESYKWYYPYAELSLREEYLATLVDCLAKRAEARGTATPTDSEVIGYMLLDLFATSALSPSVACAPFPPP